MQTGAAQRNARRGGVELWRGLGEWECWDGGRLYVGNV